MTTYFSKDPHRTFNEAHSRYKQATANQIIWNAWKYECGLTGRHNPELAEETKELGYKHYRDFREFSDEQERLYDLVTSRRNFAW